ncbi:MAG: sugar phosphate isomerase/epimerase family protein [Nitrososphaerota archaeon]
MKLSVSTAIFKASFLNTFEEDSYENMFKKVIQSGYDRIEFMPYNPNEVNLKSISNFIKNDFEICAIATGPISFYHKVSYLDPNEENRMKSIKLTKDYIDLAYKLESPIVIIGTARGKITENISLENAFEWFIECMEKIDEYAEKRNIKIVIEPINRYETNFINKLEEAIKIIDQYSLRSTYVMADTFHMNIEEPIIEESLRNSKGKILHIHIADSNRWPPGYGHINFKSIIETLKNINYKGFLSIECLPKPDINTALNNSIKYLKSILENMNFDE